jgi:hypothetical protein
MVKGLDNPKAWHKWRDTTEQTLLTQQMRLITAARKIFTDEGVPRDQHQEFLKNPDIIGTDCIRAFTNKLRTQNTTWDLKIYDMIQEKINTIKPVAINLLDVQKVVANKITDYNDIRTQNVIQSPIQQTSDYGVSTSKSSHTAEVNAIAQNSSRPESQKLFRKKRKNERERSESVEYYKPLPSVYDQPLGLLSRRQSTGSTHGRRSSWTSDNVKRHEELTRRGSSADRGRSRGRSEDRYRNRGASVATNTDAKSVYSVSTVVASPARERSKSRSRDMPIDRPAQPNYERNRRDRYEFPRNFTECSACGKRHPGGGQECQFLRHNHPDVNREQIPWKESETFRRLQKVSQSLKTLEYNRKLVRVGQTDKWMMDYTSNMDLIWAK